MPLTALLPDQAPDAAHVVAFVDDQVKLTLPPAAIVLGFAVKVIAGKGGVTETVADCEAVPPVPVQVSE